MVHKENIPWNKGKTGVYTEETRRKMSLVRKGKSSPMEGKKHTLESILKMKEAHKGFHHSEESKKKISLAGKGRVSGMKGKHHTKEWKRKMSEANKGQNNPFYGKRHSEESREKLKKRPQHFHKGHLPWNTGKNLPEEIRKKLSEAHKGKPAWNKGKKIGKPSWMKGKHHTKESNMKNRLAHLGKSAWNKGRKTGLIPWNKGLKGRLQHSEEAKLKIKESRAKQIFPVRDSLPEIKIQNFLRQLNIEFIPHKNIKEIEHRYQCDIFIPSINLVIECDGDYWHGNINNPRFKILNKYQINTKEVDNIRTKELEEKGFNVLRLWESDIEKMNLQDFMERIKPFEKV